MIQVILETVGEDREAALLAGLRASPRPTSSTAVHDFPAMLRPDAPAPSPNCRPRRRPRSRSRKSPPRLPRPGCGATTSSILGARVYEYPRACRTATMRPEEPLVPARRTAWGCCGTLTAPCCAARQRARRAHRPDPLAPHRHPTRSTVAKSNVRSRVHRRGYMDYVGMQVATAPTAGPRGEVRFVGLFTSEAYDDSGAHDVPLLRAKVAQHVLARAGATIPAATTKSACATSSRTWPRDELFQSQ
jgi:glutamate dehydrogenase